VTEQSDQLTRDLARVKDERDRLRRAATALLEVLDRHSVVVREAECVQRLRDAVGGRFPS
jgi:hypothetical protein